MEFSNYMSAIIVIATTATTTVVTATVVYSESSSIEIGDSKCGFCTMNGEWLTRFNFNQDGHDIEIDKLDAVV